MHQAERGPREFEYNEGDFARAAALFKRYTGMATLERKRDLVYSRLIRRVRLTGSGTFRVYLKKVSQDEREAEQFVNALTTNLTYFFREKHHFPILADHAACATGHRYRVWSAASSTGEEPYSIAITLARLRIGAEIVATDLDTNVLKTAREGMYSEAHGASLTPDVLQAYFLRGKGLNEGRIRVTEALRKSIAFEQLNLLRPDWCVRGKFDAIFLRNVMIYFDRPSQLAVLARLAEHLHDEGLLFTGHAESLFYASQLFRPVGPTVYKKVRRSE